MAEPRGSWPIGSRRGKQSITWEAGARGRIALRTALLVLLVVAVAGISYIVTSVSVVLSEIYDPLPPETPKAIRAVPVLEGERINVLVMGLDDEALRSDTMLLVSVDAESRKVGVLQLPRDTRARLAGKGTIEKINGAYAYGVQDREFPAPLRAMKTAEDLLGVRVHYHVTIDMEGFARIIDSIGGVWIDVPFLMEYDDPYQNLHIHLQPGRQKLSGAEALKYVRWRKNNDGTGYPDGDLGRIRAQQQFMSAVLEGLFKPSNLPFLMNQAVTVSRYVESTVEPARVVSLAKLAVSLKTGDIEFATLPGVDAYLWDNQEQKRLSFFLPDPQATQELVDRLVRGIDRRYNATVRVQVMTAGDSDKAEALAQQLAAQGYDVKPAGRANQSAPAAMRVLDHGQEPQKARVVGRSLVALGYTVEIVRAPDAEQSADVTVLIGRDS